MEKEQVETLQRKVEQITQLQLQIGSPGARVVLAVTNAKGVATLVTESQLREVLGDEFNPIVETAMVRLKEELVEAKSDAETEIDLIS